MKGVALLTLFLATAMGAQFEMECPFPEGQDVSSEAECALYTACEWSGDACFMQDNDMVGYTVSSPAADTGRGFKMGLELTDATKTLFGADIPNLVFEVIYHEDSHVQVKITDADANRYEVPVPLIFPETPGTAPMFIVRFPDVGEPFHFSIVRSSTGTEVFSTQGALTYENQFIQITTQLASSYLYGFGENTHESLRHQFEPRNTWPIFARNEPFAQGFINTYGAHPYYQVVEDDEGNTHSGLLFNSNAMEYSTFLLPDGSPALTLRTIGGVIDLHFFLGPSPEEVNIQYFDMIGSPEFPMYWTLGFHLSRWGYNNTDDIRLVRDRMRAAGIPQDVQTVDYMDRYRDFTYDPVNWGDLPTLIDELHAENVKVALPLDPAIVIDFDNYAPAARGRDADAFIKWMSPDLVPTDQPEGTNDYMVGYVMPDDKTVFPDFMRNETQDWWIQEMKTFYEELKFDMVWLDMNEPANFGTNMDQPWNWPEGQDPWSLKCPVNQWDDPPYKTLSTRVGSINSDRLSDGTLCLSAMQNDGDKAYLMYDIHSLYGWAQTRATYKALYEMFPKKRQAILSRSTFPTSGSDSIHWQGDNSADWPSLKMSIVGMIEFNMFGIPMVGSDICGFFGTADEELCSRWMQLGAFYTFSRNHNAKGLPDQDPASNPTVAAISRDVLLLRYKYLPYLYGLFHRGHMNGKTVVRPLYNVFPTDIAARDVDDQFLWGDFLMIAPVITQGATDRDVYFPEALWYDLVTGELASSAAGSLNVAAPLEKIPVYIRGGSIVPNQEPALNTVESRLNKFGLTIALDESLSAQGELYWDDGDVEHNMPETYMSMLNFTEGVINTLIKHGEDQVAGLSFDNVVFYGYPSNPTSITVNSEPLDATAWTFDEVASILRVQIDALLDIPLSMIIE